MSKAVETFSVRDTIAAAIALIEDERHWCQNAWAEDAGGNVVSPNDPAATRWCGDGALRKVLGEPYQYDPHYRVVDAIARTAGRGLSMVNDHDGHAAVLDVMRRTMEAK